MLLESLKRWNSVTFWDGDDLCRDNSVILNDNGRPFKRLERLKKLLHTAMSIHRGNFFASCCIHDVTFFIEIDDTSAKGVRAVGALRSLVFYGIAKDAMRNSVKRTKDKRGCLSSRRRVKDCLKHRCHVRQLLRKLGDRVGKLVGIDGISVNNDDVGSEDNNDDEEGGDVLTTDDDTLDVRSFS
jgi:hypothetical protein